MDPFEQLTIETPEQIALELPLAGIGSRFLAMVVDTLLQFGVLIVGALLLVGIGYRARSAAVGWLVPVLLVLLPFLFYWGYFAFFETIWKGQTPGKRVAHVRVIKESGRPITAFEAIARNLLRVVDFLPGLYGAGIACMLLNARNKRLGDFVAGTVVVYESSADAATPYVGAPPPRPATDNTPVTSDLAQLVREDLVLIETYLQRRYDLDWLVREKMAEEIAARLRRKMGLAKDPQQTDDDLLEALARRIRENARF